MNHTDETKLILKSIKDHVTFVDWRTKRRVWGDCALCELCQGIITPFQVKVTLMDGTIICNACVFIGEDLMKII